MSPGRTEHSFVRAAASQHMDALHFTAFAAPSLSTDHPNIAGPFQSPSTHFMIESKDWMI